MGKQKETKVKLAFAIVSLIVALYLADNKENGAR